MFKLIKYISLFYNNNIYIMNIFRTLDEENLIKKDLELQKKAKKLNELSKVIEEKIIEFNLNISKTNLKEVFKHAKLIEIKYNYLTKLIKDLEYMYNTSKKKEEDLLNLINEKTKKVEELQKKIDDTFLSQKKILDEKEKELNEYENRLKKKELELLERQRLLFN